MIVIKQYLHILTHLIFDWVIIVKYFPRPRATPLGNILQWPMTQSSVL